MQQPNATGDRLELPTPLLTIFDHVYEPYMTECAMETMQMERTMACPWPGLGAEITHLLLSGAGIPYQLVESGIVFQELDFVETHQNSCAPGYWW